MPKLEYPQHEPVNRHILVRTHLCTLGCQMYVYTMYVYTCAHMYYLAEPLIMEGH